MKVDISYQPSYSLGIIHFDPGEQIRAEAGAMVSMTAGITVETQATGGVLKSLGRAMFSKLKVYSGATHPHAAQQPQPLQIQE